MSLTAFAQDRDLQYWSETVETERIRDMLNYYGLTKWGFIIYRCTYGDDGAWDRFMHRLNAHKDDALIDKYDDKYLAHHLDWNAQQDPSLDRATKDQVREIATTKLPDLNANDIDAAMKIVEGTARSMGVTTN